MIELSSDKQIENFCNWLFTTPKPIYSENNIDFYSHEAYRKYKEGQND